MEVWQEGWPDQKWYLSQCHQLFHNFFTLDFCKSHTWYLSCKIFNYLPQKVLQCFGYFTLDICHHKLEYCHKKFHYRLLASPHLIFVTHKKNSGTWRWDRGAISGLDWMGWDGIRVGWGIEHLTMLIATFTALLFEQVIWFVTKTCVNWMTLVNMFLKCHTFFLKTNIMSVPGLLPPSV